MKKEIPYHPELRQLIPSLGIDNSTDLIRYLRTSHAPYIIIDRVYTSEQRIEENIDMMKNSNEVDEKSFIFVMSVPETDRVEVMHCFGMSKEDNEKFRIRRSAK
jgi:hypothetical protein